MLSNQCRLTKKKDFERVFKQGRGFKQGFLYLKFLKNNLGVSRFGFIVGKNFSKKAVERNKIKRRLREIIQKRIGGIKQGLDIIIVVLPGAENDFEALNKEIDRLFKKIK